MSAVDRIAGTDFYYALPNQTISDVQSLLNIKRISRYELTVGLETPSRDIGHRISSSSKVAIRQAIALDVAMGVASEEKNRKLQLKYDDDIDIRASLNDRQSKYLKRL